MDMVSLLQLGMFYELTCTTRAMAFLFGLIALFAQVDKNQTIPKTIEPFRYAAPSNKGNNNTTAMSSNGGYN